MVVEKVGKYIALKDISVLYRDEKDYSNCLLCHYNGVFRFTNISKQLKNYLMEEVGILHPEIIEGQRRTAYHYARRGE